VSYLALQVVPLLGMTPTVQTLVQDTTNFKDRKGVESITAIQHAKAGSPLSERLNVTSPSCTSSALSSILVDIGCQTEVQLILVNLCIKAGDPFSCMKGITVVDFTSASNWLSNFTVGLRSTTSFNVDFLLGVHPSWCGHAKVSHPSTSGKHRCRQFEGSTRE
jgi:hypothetical protein